MGYYLGFCNRLGWIMAWGVDTYQKDRVKCQPLLTRASLPRLEGSVHILTASQTLVQSAYL